MKPDPFRPGADMKPKPFRPEKGLTVEELTRQARVTEAALIDLERGLRLPNTRDIIRLLARPLDLPCEKLLAVAGIGAALDPGLSSAASGSCLRLARPRCSRRPSRPPWGSSSEC